MSAYDDNPRAQARAILRMDGADLRTRNEEELATLSSKCLTTWTRAIIRGMKGGTGFKAGNAQRRGCGDNTQDGGLAPPSLVCSFRAKVALWPELAYEDCHRPDVETTTHAAWSSPRLAAFTGNSSACCPSLPTRRLSVTSRLWVMPSMSTLRLTAGGGAGFSGACGLPLA